MFSRQVRNRRLRVRNASWVPVLVALVAAVAPLDGQELPAGITEGATVEGITEYRLDNGLRVLLFPDQSRQRITVNITYLVGSRHEGYGETGMAHLLEHLSFKGTPSHPDIPAELTEHGAFPNGTTWFDRTNYFETFPANDENLDWALDLEADRMVHSFIAREDLDSEMTVVRNEWELGENSPNQVLRKRVLSAAYDWHNYGNSTIGARADIENVPIDRLQAFYHKYYEPDNAVLVVAGRFDPGRALSLIADKFGPIPRPERTGANQLFATYTAEPAQDGERDVSLRRVGEVQIVMAAYHIPPGSHEQFAAVDVLTRILSTEPAGRLYKNLVEPGLAASASASDYQLKEPGLLIVSAQVRKGDSLDRARDALLATLGELVESPPTDEEVERIKTEYLKNAQLAFNDPQRIALDLSEWASMGDWRLLFIHRDRVAEVTPEAVHRVAQAYLKPSNRTMGYFYPVEETPLRAEIPGPPDIDALVSNYTGREAVAEGEEFDPTPANIEARTERFTLADGFEVAFMPKQNRGDGVSLTLTLRYGNEDALMGQATAGDLAGDMLMRGTKSHTRQELEDELDRLKAQGRVSGSVLSAGASFTTIRQNLPDVLRLVGEVLEQPAFDPQEFELLREERLAGLESQMTEPQALAVQAFQRHLDPRPPEHPRYTPTFEEEKERLESATLEDARAFWERFYGAQGGTMAIVGDFDPAEIRPVIEDLFGSWTSSTRYARVADPYQEVEPADVSIEAPDKANAMMIAAEPLQLTDSDPDYPALVLGNYILGGGFLNSRLATRIRQEEGLSYAVGSQLVAQPLDDSGIVLAYAIFAPENVDKVEAAFREELAKVLDGGFTEEEVAAAKRGLLDAAQNARNSDQAIAGQLSAGLFYDRTMEFTAEQEAAIRALTAGDILEAMRRHIDPERISVFKSGDFAGAKVSA